jgi:hypothetical protein
MPGACPTNPFAFLKIGEKRELSRFCWQLIDEWFHDMLFLLMKK